MVNLRVAGLTQAHKVISCMSSAFGDRQDVMHLLHRSQPTFLEARLTERMLRSVAVTNALPCSAVLAVDIQAALEHIILAAFLRAVLLTVLSVTEVWTDKVQ